MREAREGYRKIWISSSKFYLRGWLKPPPFPKNPMRGVIPSVPTSWKTTRAAQRALDV